MNPSRVIYEDAPAFIPVPADLQHRRVEAIFWPLDEDSVVFRAPAQAASGPQVDLSGPTPLSQLIGKAKGCYEDAAAADAFIRAGRDEWDR
ncbi:MAG: hypothetical protein PHW78_00075 [Macromonas bipunctata]|nr:hypothetical protein [Macromonas bipunctata]